jgi:hypothetical protein
MQTAAEARGIRAGERRSEWVSTLMAALGAAVERARERRKGRYYKPVPEVRVRFTEEDVGA